MPHARQTNRRHPSPSRTPSASSSSAASGPGETAGQEAAWLGVPPDDALPPLLAEVTFYIVTAKLDAARLHAQIEVLGGKTVGTTRDARVVITGLRGRPRLARALGSGFEQLNILSDAYIEDIYRLALSHAVPVPQATDGQGDPRPIALQLPPLDEYRVLKPKRTRSPSIELLDGPPPKRRAFEDRDKGDGDRVAQASTQLKSPPSARQTENVPEPNDEGSPPASPDLFPGMAKPDIRPLPADVRLRDIPRMCVERACPLECVNQDIIDVIKPIYVYREYDDLDQKNSNVLSYRRSMSILKSVPRRLKSGAEARKLVDIGEKVEKRIDEYLTTGRIAETDAILASERYNALQSFASVYGVGNSTAVELWNAGCRSLHDVEAHYCAMGSTASGKGDGDGEERRERRRAWRRRMGGTMTRSEVVGAWLRLKDELDTPIPRSEAEDIAALVMQNVEVLHPGCLWTIAGGYRRGKSSVADVDVIFSPPAEDPGLIKSVCRRMGALGTITHVLNFTYRDPTTPLHSGGANFDNLDKAFVILRLPGTNGGQGPGLHRRVDLIMAPRERYAAAVLSWSGSMMFERDLRRVAENQGYKFRAGLIAQDTNEEINFASERKILGYLGLAYVPPELRNADS